MQKAAETARSQERVRLARDLHDSILQDLTAANLKLKMIANTAPDDEIGRAHVCTPVTNANLVCRLLLAQTKRPHPAPLLLNMKSTTLHTHHELSDPIQHHF